MQLVVPAAGRGRPTSTHVGPTRDAFMDYTGRSAEASDDGGLGAVERDGVPTGRAGRRAATEAPRP